MQHPIRLFRAPEDKIVILGSVELLPEAAHLQGDLTAHHKEMTDIIVAPQVFLVVIGLEMGLEMTGQLHIHLVLIGIEGVRAARLV